MFRRFALVAIAALVVATPLALGSQAGATEPASGSEVPNLWPSGPPYGPFDSGETIDLSVPANTAFAAPDNTAGINIVECAAPNGVLPTQTSACDGNTLENFVGVNADGSFTFNGYFIYALPDSYSLGETASNPVTCGNTAATECVLYIGNNQNDFTQPHLWSEPFLVHTDPTDSGTYDPGDGTPEVPLAIILPLLALGLLGGAVLIRRRPRKRMS
jgi:MYXO-CTERM domain-containing protein